jgi:hypothetical protein
VWCSKKLLTCKVTPKFVSFCYSYNRQGSNIQYAEGFALQMSIIVLFEQMKSGDFKDKSGEISD